MKKLNINKKNIGKNIFAISLSLAGIISTITGVTLNKKVFKPNKISVTVTEKKVAKKKTNIPKLKDIEVEVNVPISVNIIDFIDNKEEIDEKILKKFKLDTSLVNVTEPGTYTYTISYKDKKYNGEVLVKEKELPTIENMTLKEINIEKNTSIPTNLNDYIVEDIPEEVKDKIKINTSKVNIEVASTYQYTVTYNGKIYTGKIIVFEPQTTIKPDENKEQKDKENTPDPTQPKDDTQKDPNNTQQEEKKDENP